MSVDLACPQSPPCSKASNSKEISAVPEIYGPEEKDESSQMSSAETLHTKTVSPLPSSMGLLIQNSPDSSTSPSIILPTSAENIVKKEEKVEVKKQKIRTVFSQAQLSILNERFQRQQYLSLQQMQELSTILNLSYKQIKTWFQNQRMKCKRWQKYNWQKNSNWMTQNFSVTAEYPGLSPCHQGRLMNASGNFSMWSNQTCNNPAWNNQSWSYHSWNHQTWCPPAWNNQSWNNQVWNNQFYSCGEETLLPQIQFQQNQHVSDLEATLETAGESYDMIQQTHTFYSTQQIMDLFPNYSINIQPDDV